MDRRKFLGTASVFVAAGIAAACEAQEAPAAADADAEDWEAVRAQFNLTDEFVHLGALYIASHPKPVRDAIEEHRRGLDANPVIYLDQQNRRRRAEVRNAAGRYLGVNGEDVALTDSTTMGLGLVYNGLRLEPGQEILLTGEDYFVTHESVRLAAERTGAAVRQIDLFDDIETVTAEEIVDNIRNAIRPETRLLPLTWVHSSTGLKLPLAQIGEALGEINDDRDEDDRVLLCIDGVHGFGVENVELGDLGADFFMAGCHKWLFGPRGTGIVWGRPAAWPLLQATIPSFIDDATWHAWLTGEDVPGETDADRMTPGGFKAFEHYWAVTQAFEFHLQIGKARVERRAHSLNRQLKEGLAEMPHVRLVTPIDEALSSGITCFDVEGMSPRNAVRRLRDRGIIGTATPYATRHARLTPCIYNTPEEIDRALEEIRRLG